jgi:hypothetical protein
MVILVSVGLVSPALVFTDSHDGDDGGAFIFEPATVFNHLSPNSLIEDTILRGTDGGKDTLENTGIFSPNGLWSDMYGRSTAMFGDYLFVGAPAEFTGFTPTAIGMGAVYIYKRDGSTWVFQQKLTGEEALIGPDGFADPSGVSGRWEWLGGPFFDRPGGPGFEADEDTLLVGVPGDFVGSIDRAGSVYVYQLEGPSENKSWVFKQRLISDAPASNGVFGDWTTLDGEWAFISEPHLDRVHVFREIEEGNWQRVGTPFTSPDGQRPFNFGMIVVLDGSHAMIGEPFNDGDGGFAGAVFVYELVDDEWQYSGQRLSLFDNPDRRVTEDVVARLLGTATAIDGGWALMSAPHPRGFFRARPPKRPGIALFYHLEEVTGEGKQWVFKQEVLASDGHYLDGFGRSLDLEDGFAVISAPKHDSSVWRFPDLPGSLEGAAYVFRQMEDDTWVEIAKITHPESQDRLLFGSRVQAVAIENGWAVVGTDPNDTLGRIGDPTVPAGSAIVFRLNDDGDALAVTIDIKPGIDPNFINPENRGLIPVAILTTESFDALTVSPSSVQFGPKGAGIAHHSGHLIDVDSDGDLDLLLHYRSQQSGIQCGDTEASLFGETFDAQAIQGSDSIVTVSCN